MDTSADVSVSDSFQRAPACSRNQIPSLLEVDWAHLKDTLTSLYLGENDLTALPQGRAAAQTSAGPAAAQWTSNDVLGLGPGPGPEGNGNGPRTPPTYYVTNV